MKVCNTILAAGLAMTGLHASAANFEVSHEFYDFAGGYSDNNRLIVNNGHGVGFGSTAYLEFDLNDLGDYTTGDTAYLNLDMYCNPSLTCTGSSPSGATMDISVYQIASGDVGNVFDTAGLASLSLGAVVDTLTVSAEGLYSWDITSLLPSLIGDNVGLALLGGTSSDGGLYNNYFAASHIDFGTGDLPLGLAPTITTVSAVPIPAAGWLMGSALAALLGISRRRSRQHAAGRQLAVCSVR